MKTTLHDLIDQHPDHAIAIGEPGREWLTYAGLRSMATSVRQSLRQFGIGAQDRVAIVLANGSDMASAFVTIAQAATTAPLNPSYREDEFAFYLEDLGAKAIVLKNDYDGPARQAAEKLGLIVLNLIPTSRAGEFTLAGPDANAAQDVTPTEDDVALILHTSGTTSRPKIVPLLQRNVAASAQNIAASLALTETDRCLNVMPLFHIHGLVAAVSATFASGGSIYCTHGFNAMNFFAMMSEARPTWYTAVPTMHQAILSRAGRNADV